MRKKTKKSYFMIFVAIFILMSISKESADRMRGATAATFEGFWNMTHDFKLATSSWFNYLFSSSGKCQTPNADEIQHLKLKNQLLEEELRKIQGLLPEDLVQFFKVKNDFIPAQVIFRSPSTWNSSLWVNVGLEDNKKKGKEIIQKNSPVLFGTSVIGLIDYVGNKQSRVRLITDSGLRPSVRVKRIVDNKTLFLAKGELHGSSQPLWRSKAQILHGMGFNYDFSDAEGCPRDLRTGKPLIQGIKSPSLPIIKVDDLLVTSGLDGVFPAGLDVATVTKLKPLKEGDYYFEIEAKPTAKNLYDLSLVFLLPPMGYDQPSAHGW
jgi:rod shape-determining protein MreC